MNPILPWDLDTVCYVFSLHDLIKEIKAKFAVFNLTSFVLTILLYILKKHLPSNEVLTDVQTDIPGRE